MRRRQHSGLLNGGPAEIKSAVTAWFQAMQSGDECPDLAKGIHPFSQSDSMLTRCPYYGKVYPEEKLLSYYTNILQREGFSYIVKECDTQGPTCLKIYCLCSTQVPMFQSSNRYTLPVFVNRAVDVPRPNLLAVFPNTLVHNQWPKLIAADHEEKVEYCKGNYQGRQRSVYLRALQQIDAGEDNWKEGAINKLDETLFTRAIMRDDFLDNDPTQGTSWKIRQRIVQSSHPKVTAQITHEVDKITKRLIKDWEEPFIINGYRVLFIYASKMTQHQMTEMIFQLFERFGVDLDFISMCAGDDSLLAYQHDGQIWFLEADCSHMDASEWDAALEFNYRCYARLGMSRYALNLLRKQDSGPRLYTHAEGVVIVTPPAGIPIKNTGSNTTSIGNTLSAQAIVHETISTWNGRIADLKQTYINAATNLNFVVKVECAPWELRQPTFLKNILTTAGFVLECGLVVKMGKTLTNPVQVTGVKDYLLAWRHMIFAMAKCYRFYKVDLVVDAMLRYFERIGLPFHKPIRMEHYLMQNLPQGPGSVYTEFDIYERYQLTRAEVEDCIKMIDSVQVPFVIFSHPVFDRLGGVAYG